MASVAWVAIVVFSDLALERPILDRSTICGPLLSKYEERLDSLNWREFCESSRTMGQSWDRISVGVRNEGEHPWFSISNFERHSIVRLNLSALGLSGKLPTKITQLRSLTRLDLSSNEFEGSLPVEWSTLTKLKRLDVSNNVDLEASIPAAWKRSKMAKGLVVRRENTASKRAPPPSKYRPGSSTEKNQAGLGGRSKPTSEESNFKSSDDWETSIVTFPRPEEFSVRQSKVQKLGLGPPHLP